MALVRLATMPAGDQVEQLLARIDALERKLAGEVPGGGSAAPPAGREGGGAAGSGGRPTRGTPRAGRGGPGPSPESAAAPARTLEAPLHRTPDAPLPIVFDRLRAFAQESNRGLFASLEGGRLLACGEGALRIALPSGLAARRLEDRRAELEEVCGRFFGGPVQVLLEAPGAGPDAPDPSRGREGEAEEVRRRRLAALAHPAVNDALEILGAEILEIRPLGALGDER
jgi:hypothetical protein